MYTYCGAFCIGAVDLTLKHAKKWFNPYFILFLARRGGGGGEGWGVTFLAQMETSSLPMTG